MVKQLRITVYYLRLMRWQNLVIIGFTQAMVRYFILKPLLQKAGLTLQMTVFDFLLLVASTQLISAAGYIINDYFDRKTDFINRPRRVIVGKVISRRMAMTLHFVFSAVGVALGFYLSYTLGVLYLGIIFLMVSGALWFYSTTYKNQLIVGNVIIALMVALVPLIVLLYELPLQIRIHKLYLLGMNISLRSLTSWVGGYAIFAFLTNLTREIVKDIEDFEGDSVFGRKTIPIQWGASVAKWVTIGLNIVVIVATLLVLFLPNIGKLSAMYGVLTIVTPLSVASVLTFYAQTSHDYHMVSQLMKVVMVLGLSFCIVYHYFNYAF